MITLLIDHYYHHHYHGHHYHHHYHGHHLKLLAGHQAPASVRSGLYPHPGLAAGDILEKHLGVHHHLRHVL